MAEHNSLTMALRKMTTRRSSRELQAQNVESVDLEEGMQRRDYSLNYDKALRKKAKACQAEYLVSSEVKCDNYIFSFSAAMYELYRENLARYFSMLNDDSSDIKVTFKDISDKTGMVTESLLKVFQKIPNSKDELKYTINMYHTKSRVMVNGNQAIQFNDEHSKITDYILDSEKVSDLDKEMYRCIEECLKALKVDMSQSDVNQKPKKATVKKNLCEKTKTCISISNQNEPELNAGNEDDALCPSCDLIVNDGINCEKCDAWYHYDCENINDSDRRIHENTDSEYICMTCNFENQCEGINNSLIIDSRNIQESVPGDEYQKQTLIHGKIEEETKRKEGYESDVTILNNFDINKVPVKDQVSECTTTIKEKELGQIKDNLNIKKSIQKSDKTNKDKGQTPIANCSSIDVSKQPADICEEVEILNSQNVESSKNDPPIIEQKVKQTRKIGKQKIKENEQEEQLKLAKSVINNLEIKMGELENSNSLMKQELILMKSKNINGMDSSISQSFNPTNQSIPTGETVYVQNPTNSNIKQTQNEIDNLKEQVRSLDMEMIKHRLHSLERNQLQPTHFCHPSVHPQFGQSPYGGFMGVQNPYFGASPFPNPYMSLGGSLNYGGIPNPHTQYVPAYFPGFPHHALHPSQYMTQIGQHTHPIPNLVYGAAPPLLQGYIYGPQGQIIPTPRRANQEDPIQVHRQPPHFMNDGRRHSSIPPHQSISNVTGNFEGIPLMKNRPLQRTEIPSNQRQSRQAEAATETIQTELQVPSSKRGWSAPKNSCTRESETMETSPPKQARLAPVNPDEIEYECSTPRDERFSPETSSPALTEAQNYKTVKQHHVPDSDGDTDSSCEGKKQTGIVASKTKMTGAEPPSRDNIHQKAPIIGNGGEDNNGSTQPFLVKGRASELTSRRRSF